MHAHIHERIAKIQRGDAPLGYRKTKVGIIPDEWILSYIQDFSNISTGSKDTQDKVDGGDYPFFVRSQKVERINSYSYEGVAVLTAGAGVGVGKVFHYIDGKFDFHQRVYKISDFKSHIHPFYFFQYFKQNFLKETTKYTAKTSVDSVRMEMIAKMEVPLPPLPEQRRIAAILSAWDDAIRLQQELIAQKQTQKRGLMQLLLTGAVRVTEMGRLSPEAVAQRTAAIRQGRALAGYRKTKVGIIPDEWEVKFLGEIGVFSKGKGITNNQKIKTGLPCITYGEIYTTHHFFIKKFRSFISNATAETSKAISKGDILFAGSGETLDEIGKCVAYLDDKEAYAGGDIIILSPYSTINSKYFAYLLNSDVTIRQRRKLGQGHSVVHIYPNSLKTSEFAVPPLPEQHQIADILTTADREIELLDAELEQLRTQKKGLTQLLLTGAVRAHEGA